MKKTNKKEKRRIEVLTPTSNHVFMVYNKKWSKEMLDKFKELVKNPNYDVAIYKKDKNGFSDAIYVLFTHRKIERKSYYFGITEESVKSDKNFLDIWNEKDGKRILEKIITSIKVVDVFDVYRELLKLEDYLKVLDEKIQILKESINNLKAKESKKNEEGKDAEKGVDNNNFEKKVLKLKEDIVDYVNFFNDELKKEIDKIGKEIYETTLKLFKKIHKLEREIEENRGDKKEENKEDSSFIEDLIKILNKHNIKPEKLKRYLKKVSEE